VDLTGMNLRAEGDREFLTAVLAVFIAAARTGIADIQAALEGNEIAAIARAAHSLTFLGSCRAPKHSRNEPYK
jgi:HPt (histidine-containing phosphotransfer) domain-containing protein